MKRLLPLILLCFLVIGQSFAQVQLPPKCHHAEHILPTKPLTEEEKLELQAIENRSDTFDVTHYDVKLEVDMGRSRIIGNCTIQFKAKMDNLSTLRLDFLDLSVQSVKSNGADLTYQYDRRFLDVDLPNVMNTDDEASIEVIYSGTPTVDPGGFGGLAFDNGYAYNLGIGLNSNPVNFGRSWHPCFDNFQERATYDFEITSSAGNRGFCSGVFMGETQLGGDTIVRSYSMDQPLPTYLAGIAVSSYSALEGVHQGVDEELSTLLVSKTPDTAALRASFADLPKAIDAFEHWYGPYIWGQVGFVMTTRGAMEHATLIAYPAGVGLGGLDFAQNRLMAHELAHHWFGNMVTVEGPSEMWFKEGNAEYGAHLFTEFAEGKVSFLSQVKTNHKTVMLTAHLDDDGYQPLSGIPFEHTYGTHTYYRGASMIHNLRGYLGDSLFRVGQQAILNERLYQSAGASTYEPILTQATGVDMSNFFDDWIRSTGYTSYEAGEMQITNTGGSNYTVDLAIDQKLRAAPNYHQKAPVQVTFYSANGERAERIGEGDGPTNMNTFDLPFSPSYVVINEDNRLNLAQFHDAITVTQTGNFSLPFTDMRLAVRDIGDPADVKVDHYWVGPDTDGVDPAEARLSKNHYWKVSGNIPSDINLAGNIEYNGLRQPFFDADLVSITEDSLIVAYREGPGFPWVEYDDYRVTNLSDTDQAGLVRINQLRPGEYTFANGSLPLLTSVPEIDIVSELQIFPNPSSSYIQLRGELKEVKDLSLDLVDLSGKEILNVALQTNGNHFNQQIPVSHLARGTYFLHFRGNEGQSLFTKKIEIQ